MFHWTLNFYFTLVTVFNIFSCILFYFHGRRHNCTWWSWYFHVLRCPDHPSEAYWKHFRLLFFRYHTFLFCFHDFSYGFIRPFNISLFYFGHFCSQNFSFTGSSFSRLASCWPRQRLCLFLFVSIPRTFPCVCPTAFTHHWNYLLLSIVNVLYVLCSEYSLMLDQHVNYSQLITGFFFMISLLVALTFHCFVYLFIWMFYPNLLLFLVVLTQDNKIDK